MTFLQYIKYRIDKAERFKAHSSVRELMFDIRENLQKIEQLEGREQIEAYLHANIGRPLAVERLRSAYLSYCRVNNLQAEQLELSRQVGGIRGTNKTR